MPTICYDGHVSILFNEQNVIYLYTCMCTLISLGYLKGVFESRRALTKHAQLSATEALVRLMTF